MDDEPSQDSDVSFSSVSAGGISDEDMLDEVTVYDMCFYYMALHISSVI